ncbi:MAG: dockerin type I repeat-containing protein, partial [Clostridia bacterium]|nr:dockerin type I repeat-containing protein [Clostridia bacterium]
EAFAFSDSLSKVTIPASVESIGEDIVWSGYYLMFDDSHVYRAKIYGEKDSYAEEYAEKYGISFVAAAKLSYGNIDGDDMVTSADALIILRASVGLENFNSEQRKFADVNGDDRVDSADSLAVLRYSVGFKDKGIKID